MQNKQGLRVMKTLFKWQITVIGLSAISIAIIQSQNSALSFILGSLVNVLPTMGFAALLFWHSGAQAARQIASNLYKGEALKWVLTALLFAVAFTYKPLKPLSFFMGFIVAQMLIWVVLFFDNKQKQV